MHGDYRLGNTIFAADAPARLESVLDWEMATIGDPLADLGLLLVYWSEPGDAQHSVLGVAPTALPGFAITAPVKAPRV